MERQLRYKREVLGLVDAKPDPRDLNRGRIVEADLQRDEAQHLYQGMSAIFTTRLALIDHFTHPPARIEAPATVFAAEYTADGERLRIYINLSAGEQELPVRQAVPRPELEVNDVSVSGNTLYLGPYAGAWLRGGGLKVQPAVISTSSYNSAGLVQAEPLNQMRRAYCAW